MQVGAEQLDALDIVPLVELLVDGVGAVGRATHRQKQHVLARRLLEAEGHGDAI